jgi:outer-membrane receptor for ferric coprogen and ferric-rhodotorulic acid
MISGDVCNLLRKHDINVRRNSLGCLCACIAAAASAAAPDERATYSLRIGAQPLERALQEFARQSGIQVVFFSAVTDGVDAPAVEGTYTVEDAMDQLLGASGLAMRRINPQTVEIRRGNANARPVRNSRPRSIVAKQDRIEEVIVVGSAEQLVATRIDTPLLDIPQTVAIISQEQMRQQNHFELADALDDAPGITQVRTTSLDELSLSRAYEIRSFHIDGGGALASSFRTAIVFDTAPDLSEYDHIEVLRGADALFGGNGNPGGTVSLVRKRPLGDPQLSLSLSGGSWDAQRAELDLTGPIARDGALRGRVDVISSRKGYFYEVAELERKKIFAAVEYDFTPDATLTVGGGIQWDDAVPYAFGLPHYANGRDSSLPRDTALAFDWAYLRTHIREGYVQYRQEFRDTWSLKLNASTWHTKTDFGFASFGGLIDPVTRGVARPPSASFSGSPNIHRKVTADVTLTGVLDWFGMREEVAIGGDFTRLQAHVDVQEYGSFGAPLADVTAFDPRNYPNPRPGNSYLIALDGTTTMDQYGTFASLRVYFDDKWSAVAGARIGSNTTDSKLTLRGLGLAFPVSARFGTLHVLTPYAGLMYKFAANYSLYASYADIYLGQSTHRRLRGDPLDPTHGINMELGLKGQWRDGALNGTLVFYRIAQRNLPLSDPRPRPPDLPSVDNCCFRSGTSRSKGADLQLSGEIASGWLIGGGYTYNLNQGPVGGELSVQTPKHLLKVWTSKRLNGVLDRWTIGGSVHAQTDVNNGVAFYCAPGASECTGFDVIQSGYATVDLRVGFQLNRNWRLALNVNNVLDKDYYESLGQPALHAWYGEPRNYMLRVDGDY